uniref:SadenosylLmethioninedependent methyltransferase mraWlike protein putative n=1 Tax=Albugo laibachii Nc14 TaxID=890382 RepID=F0W8A4_9STRA|nr:SadenosylLmethioninedependent methyltransferase mraWlike protein putative [Albugo laibachii Nc14]|eukprot:CCA17304.1 SadenosylLmethioninedependent methyltransferase mraWlike protein putative [Albugo laibachii Nc14]
MRLLRSVCSHYGCNEVVLRRLPDRQRRKFYHVPVLIKSVTKLLVSEEMKVPRYFVDATVGCAGHAQKILESDPNIRMLCIDRDPEVLSIATDNLKKFTSRVKFVNGSYADLENHLKVSGFPSEVSGILVDLGVNSLHYDKPERGFSWLRDGPLNMRFDESDSTIDCAADILQTSSEVELTRIFREYGELKCAKEYAKAIVRKRETAAPGSRAFETTFHLRDAIEEVAAKWRPKRLSPSHASKTNRSSLARPITGCFQALRIQVNKELAHVHEGVPVLANHLTPGARLVTIAFHSLEDRPIKQIFRTLAHELKDGQLDSLQCDLSKSLRGKTFRFINKKVVKPCREEVVENPRSRSARLRCLERAK